MNKLYYGDNLSIMEGMAKYSVDLVYLVPTELQPAIQDADG